MPTSNGQVSSRDIRQKAIKTNHLIDSAVTTAKVAATAITEPKLDDPFQWDRESIYVTDLTLTTSWQELAQVTVDVPSWAGRAALLVDGAMQVSTAGSASLVGVQFAWGDGTPTAVFIQNSIPASSTETLSAGWVREVTTPGATLTAELWGIVLSGGSSLGTTATLVAFAYFAR